MCYALPLYIRKAEAQANRAEAQLKKQFARVSASLLAAEIKAEKQIVALQKKLVRDELALLRSLNKDLDIMIKNNKNKIFEE